MRRRSHTSTLDVAGFDVAQNYVPSESTLYPSGEPLASLEEAEDAVNRLKNSPAMARWKESRRTSSPRKGSILKNSDMSLSKQRSFSDAAVVLQMERSRKEKAKEAVFAERKAHAIETMETLLRMSANGEIQPLFQSMSDISKLKRADVQLLLDREHWESEVAARAAACVDAKPQQTVKEQQQKQQQLQTLEQSHAKMGSELKKYKDEEAKLKHQIRLYQAMAAKLQHKINTHEADVRKIKSQMDHIKISLYPDPV